MSVAWHMHHPLEMPSGMVPGEWVAGSAPRAFMCRVGVKGRESQGVMGLLGYGGAPRDDPVSTPCPQPTLAAQRG